MAARPQGATRSSRARLADRDGYPSLGTPVNVAARSSIVMGPPPRVQLVTHEYAHHVQSLSGVINAAYQAWGPTDEYSRRIEMHAHCLSFALITHVPGFGVTAADLTQFRNGWARGPDSTKFGSIASQQAYGEKGLAATQVGDCDSFSASTVS